MTESDASRARVDDLDASASSVVVGAMTFRFTLHEPFQPADLTEPSRSRSIGVVGLIVALHQPRNPIGWILPRSVGRRRRRLRSPAGVRAYWVETLSPERSRRSRSRGVDRQLDLGSRSSPCCSHPVPAVPRRAPRRHRDGDRSPGGSRSRRRCGRRLVRAQRRFRLPNACNERRPQPVRAPSLIASAVTVVRIALSFVMIGLMAADASSLVIRYPAVAWDERRDRSAG